MNQPNSAPLGTPDRMSASKGKVFLFAAVLMIVDYWSGPNIQFGLFHVIPVMLAAWYHGAATAVALAVALAATRFAFHWIWDFPVTLTTALVNNTLRLAMLTIVAFAVGRIGEHVRSLRERVVQLERLLPVCARCGVVQRADGSWAPVSTLEAPPIPPICPRCDEKHYGITG